MNDDPNAFQWTPLRLALLIFGSLSLILGSSTGLGRSRGREFNAAPPQQETWRATIHSNTWDDSLAVDTPCAVRQKSAMWCRRGCGLFSITYVECGGRTLASARGTDRSVFVQRGNVDEYQLDTGSRMLWDHAANTLILESTASLEPRRLALQLAPTSTVEVDPHCRATSRDAWGIDSTPECGYAYLDYAP